MTDENKKDSFLLENRLLVRVVKDFSVKGSKQPYIKIDKRKYKCVQSAWDLADDGLIPIDRQITGVVRLEPLYPTGGELPMFADMNSTIRLEITIEPTIF